MADQTAAIDAVPAPRSPLHLPRRSRCWLSLAATGTLATNILLPSLPQMAASLKVSTAGGNRRPSPSSLRYSRLASSWSGRSPIASAGAGRCWQASLYSLPAASGAPRHRPAGAADRPRHPGGRRLLDLGAVPRHRPRHVFTGAALGRAMALIMIAMAAAPGFSPLLGGALDHVFGWRSEFVFVAIFAALGAVAYVTRCSARPIMRRAPRSIRSRSPKTISA